jgi:hypothetical protein
MDMPHANAKNRCYRCDMERTPERAALGTKMLAMGGR